MGHKHLTKIGVKTIDHIGILTNDLQKSVKFYTDVLGFSVSRKIEMAEAGLSAVFVEKDGSKIELHWSSVKEFYWAFC